MIHASITLQNCSLSIFSGFSSENIHNTLFNSYPFSYFGVRLFSQKTNLRYSIATAGKNKNKNEKT